MNRLFLGVLFAAGGSAVFLLTFWWERGSIKNAMEEVMRSEADGTRFRIAVETFEREQNAMEWTRAIGGIGMLIGILLCTWA